ncbi:MAG: hypothetical protein WCI04_00635 [archaeon]
MNYKLSREKRIIQSICVGIIFVIWAASVFYALSQPQTVSFLSIIFFVIFSIVVFVFLGYWTNELKECVDLNINDNSISGKNKIYFETIKKVILLQSDTNAGLFKPGFISTYKIKILTTTPEIVNLRFFSKEDREKIVTETLSKLKKSIPVEKKVTGYYNYSG